MFTISPRFLFPSADLSIAMMNLAISGKYSKWLINIRFMLRLILISESQHFAQETVPPFELKPNEKFRTKTNGICVI